MYDASVILPSVFKVIVGQVESALFGPPTTHCGATTVPLSGMICTFVNFVGITLDVELGLVGELALLHAIHEALARNTQTNSLVIIMRRQSK